MIVDDNKIILPTLQSENHIYNSKGENPLTYGIVFQLISILKLPETTFPEAKNITYAECRARIISVSPRTSGDEYKFSVPASTLWLADDTGSESEGLAVKVYIPMSEDEVRYAMGVQDLFDQISYEEYIHHLP